jgi:uncharacterized membrane protein
MVENRVRSFFSWWLHPPSRYWLALSILVYVAGAWILSILRLLNFNAATWDLGIFQQALWSAGHGRIFYESGDFEFTTAQSFFQLHPSFLLYAIVPLYSWLPSPITLLALQSIAVGLAAIPLYRLTGLLTGSDRKALLAAGLYLIWTPILSGNLYDFHLESFLPVELLTLFYFVLRRWSVAALLTAILPAITLEVGPVLVFFMGFFFAVPSGSLVARAARTLVPVGGGERSFRPRLRSLRAIAQNWLSDRVVRVGLALMAISFGLYLAVRYVQGTVILWWLPSGSGLPPHLAGVNPARLGLSWAGLSVGFFGKLEYWVLIYALVAFLPFRAPKTLLLVAPWFVFTVFSATVTFSRLGFQYGFIVAAPVFIGVAYGLSTISLDWIGSRTAAPSRPSGVPPHVLGEFSTRAESPSDAFPEPRPRSSRRWPRPTLRSVGGSLSNLQRNPWFLILGMTILLNIGLSPVNPLVQHTPGVGGGYQVAYSLGKGTAQVLEVASLVPANATILASDFLFPFVANHVRAYTLTSSSVIPPHLPFTAANLPTYVFICRSQLEAVPLWLSYDLYTANVYGLRAVVGQTSLGPVLLFQTNYTGPELDLLPITYSGTLYSGRALDVGQGGALVPDPNSESGVVIESQPGLNFAIWYGPYATLPAGAYSIQVAARAVVPAGAPIPGPKQPVVGIVVSAFGHHAMFDRTYDYATLGGTYWTDLNFSIASNEPLLEFQVVGIPSAFPANLVVELNYILVAPR